MAVLRCLNFWKSGYIILINAFALKISHRNLGSGRRMSYQLAGRMMESGWRAFSGHGWPEKKLPCLSHQLWWFLIWAQPWPPNQLLGRGGVLRRRLTGSLVHMACPWENRGSRWHRPLVPVHLPSVLPSSPCGQPVSWGLSFCLKALAFQGSYRCSIQSCLSRPTCWSLLGGFLPGVFSGHSCWLCHVYYLKWHGLFVFLNTLFFRAVSDSGQNWAEDTEISHSVLRCFCFSKWLLAMWRLITKVGISGSSSSSQWGKSEGVILKNNNDDNSRD